MGMHIYLWKATMSGASQVDWWWCFWCVLPACIPSSKLMPGDGDDGGDAGQHHDDDDDDDAGKPYS